MYMESHMFRFPAFANKTGVRLSDPQFEFLSTCENEDVIRHVLSTKRPQDLCHLVKNPHPLVIEWFEERLRKRKLPKTLLSSLAENPHDTIVDYMISSELNLPQFFKNTNARAIQHIIRTRQYLPLDDACANTSDEMVQFLIENEAKLCVRNPNFWTNPNQLAAQFVLSNIPEDMLHDVWFWFQVIKSNYEPTVKAFLEWMNEFGWKTVFTNARENWRLYSLFSNSNQIIVKWLTDTKWRIWECEEWRTSICQNSNDCMVVYLWNRFKDHELYPMMYHNANPRVVDKNIERIRRLSEHSQIELKHDAHPDWIRELAPHHQPTVWLLSLLSRYSHFGVEFVLDDEVDDSFVHEKHIINYG